MSVPATEPKEQTSEQTNPPQPGNGTGEQKPETTERRFTQAELDAIVQDRLDRDRKARERDTEKAKREAEEKALKDQQEWRALAEKHAARLAELEPLQQTVEETAAQLERYKAALEAHLATQRTDLPDYIGDLLDRMDPVEQLDWLAKNRDQLGQRPGNGGLPVTPRATGSGTMTREQLIEQEAQKGRRTGRYSI